MPTFNNISVVNSVLPLIVREIYRMPLTQPLQSKASEKVLKPVARHRVHHSHVEDCHGLPGSLSKQLGIAHRPCQRCYNWLYAPQGGSMLLHSTAYITILAFAVTPRFHVGTPGFLRAYGWKGSIDLCNMETTKLLW